MSHYLPAWWLGNAPNDQVMLASYHGQFAASWGRKARDTFKEVAPELWGLKLRWDMTSSAEWGIAGHVGGMRSAGVGGSLTGKGADLLIVDDPIRNQTDALSPTVRQTHWDWWQSTAYTRLEPRGVAIVMMTRWHADDLVGKLLAEMKNGGEHWTVITMPAIAEEHEVWQYGSWRWERQVGDPLWPERFPLPELEKIRRTTTAGGPYWWTALYQQRPQERGGGIFKAKWFRYFREEKDYYVLIGEQGEKRVPKDVCQRFMICDPAASEKRTADYTVVGHFALTPDSDLLQLDLMREQIQGPEVVTLMCSLWERWGRPSFIGIESVAYQIMLVQMMVRRGYPVRAITADKDKVSRALVLAARMETGNFYQRAGAEYLDVYQEELLLFPKGPHDDMVDVGAMAASQAVGIREPSIRIID